MIEWISALLSPVIGAGAGSMFQQLFKKKQRNPGLPKDAPSRGVAALTRDVDELLEWQEDAREVLMFQQKQILRLKREVRATRLMLDVFLVLLLLACCAFWYFQS